MATSTTYYGLRKPAGGDFVTVSTDINANMDSIDTALHGHETRLTAVEGELTPVATEYTAVPGGWTVAASVTINNFNAFKLGRMRFISINFNWTGATITGSATGNIGDTDVFSAIPADWTPPLGATFVFQQGGVTFGQGVIFASGKITLQTMHTGGTIASGNAVQLTAIYYV